MYHTCLHCTRDLGKNDVVEALPIGRRIAFDPARGRLWVICRSCAKWNLVPFDNRLEAIDACARLFHDTRKRFSTENIGLARMQDGTDLVRIGEPQRPEFASWRYGAQYRRRRRVNMVVGGAGTIGMVTTTNLITSAVSASSFALGVGVASVVMLGSTFAWTQLDGWRRRVIARVEGMPGLVRIQGDLAPTAHVSFNNDDLSVSWSPGFGAALRKRHVTVSGPDTRLLLRKILGSVNRSAGSTKDLAAALARVGAGGMHDWLTRLGPESVEFTKAPVLKRLQLGASQGLAWVDAPSCPVHYPGFNPQSFAVSSLPRADRLAIEMWLSEEDEARALAGELALLEGQWREAEELAAIADGLSLSEGET